MKVTGLITEYNPFHNGHLYHMQKAQELTGADAVVAVMSGNYVQRGAPAVMPKHLRAKMALEAGVSAVFELPLCCALGSAEYFAEGAVSLLEHLGCVDAICFGSECGDLTPLQDIAEVLAEEPEAYRLLLKKELKNGASFPQARQTALSSYLKNEKAVQLMAHPNNILGIEYLKALYKRNSPIKAYTISRIASGYHDQALSENYSSATAIRTLLTQTENRDIPSMLAGQVPPAAFRILTENWERRGPVCADDFSLIFKYKLLEETSASLIRYADITEDLANRILKYSDRFVSFSQFCNLLNTKEMTYARISRCLFHILLNITGDDMAAYKKEDFCSYARLLGFRKDRESLLSLIKEKSPVPLVTKLADAAGLSSTGTDMLEHDIFAAGLYESVITEKYKLPFISEYRQQIVRV